MKMKAINELLRGSPLTGIDAARLILECIEELGGAIEDMNRETAVRQIRRVIHKGVHAVKEEERTVPLEEAAWKSVEARAGRRAVTLRDLRHFVRRILRVKGAAELPLRTITGTQCRHILAEAFGNSPSSYRKGRTILHSIFAYGIRQEWCDSNPVDRVEVPRIQEKNITPLSLAEVKRLLRTAEQARFRDMRLPLQLLLFCGVRPTEITRIQPEDIHWQDKELIIRPNTSKTGGGRIIPLRNIAPSLLPRVIPGNWATRWKALRQAAGFSQWQADVCRHTFASYHAAHFRNLPELQLEMGHRDTTLLRTRYISPIRQEDAEAYWTSGSRGMGGVAGEVTSTMGAIVPSGLPKKPPRVRTLR